MTSHVNRELADKRSIRQTILNWLNISWETNPGNGTLVRVIMHGLLAGSIGLGEPAIREALADLIERGLIARKESVIPGDPTEYVILTARGRDFVNHDYPWDQVDSFSRHAGGPA
jgi:hypothetical protein